MSYPDPASRPPEASPAPALPGYPRYPQGGAPVYPYPAPVPGAPYGVYPYPGHSPYPGNIPYYPWPYFPPPKRDTYRLVIGIVATVLLSLTILLGLVLAFILVVAGANGTLDNLVITSFLGFGTLAALGGGGVGLYFTIRALMGRPSAQMKLPPYVVPLFLTLVVLTVGIIQHDTGLPQALALLETPLLLLSGILPALTVFTFTAQRLGYPTTWRRAWMAYLSGTFLATLIAIILELVAAGILAALLKVDAGSITSNPSTTPQLIATIVLTAAVAPLVEEGFKPVGPLTIIGRIRGPAEAFILGMAAGIGFAILETTEYIGGFGGADWIIVAMERIGAGLIHGVGAGMAMLGWYYIFRGKGVSQRYLKGFGAIIYAILQHGIFNGSTFLELVPGPIGNALQTPIWFFGLPETAGILVPYAIYAAIIGVLITVTSRLRSSAPAVTTPPAVPAPQPPAMPVPGGVR
jgi:RsiW-degrading membrane proteinase PrsW (M82 family)